MELQQFVTKTLVQIAAGVRDAQGAVARSGARINPAPKIVNAHLTSGGLFTSTIPFLPIRDVQFDLAVTVGEGTESTAKISVVAFVLGAGADRTLDKRSEEVSRVRFSVPIAYPPEHVQPASPASGEESE